MIRYVITNVAALVNSLQAFPRTRATTVDVAKSYSYKAGMVDLLMDPDCLARASAQVVRLRFHNDTLMWTRV